MPISKHTPAPWKRSKYKVFSASGALIAHTRPTVECSGEDEANARLIAAAPELLQALLDLIGTMCSADGVDLEDDLDCIDSCVESAHEAIAKATWLGAS